MSDLVQLSQCYDNLVQGMVKCDTKLMDSVMADSIILFHANGDKQSKKDWLDIVEKKEIIYHSGETIYFEITINGNSAEIKATTRLEVTSKNHPKSTFELSQSLIAEKLNGEWKLTKSVPGSLK